MNSYLIYALIAVGIFTAYMAIINLFRKDRMRARVKAAAETAVSLPQEEESTPASASFCAAMVSLTGVNVRDQKPLALLLQQAGLRSPHAVTYFLFFKRIVQPILLVVGGFIFLRVIASNDLGTLQKALRFVVAGIFIVIGLFGASLYVTNRKQHRQQKLLWSFPEALDLLLVCIESGLGLDAALARVCTELKATHPEITEEFERTRTELTMLSDRSQALQNLAERTEIVPFKSLVASLIQTEKFGTSLLETLRVLSEDQRVTRLLNAENRAARIPVLITIPLILCILPSFIIIILGPPIVRVMNQGGIFGSKTPH